jgi:hypothetical protein
MHGPINVKSPKNISKWQIGFNSAFKGLTGNRGAMMGIHVETARLVDHIVKGALTTNLTANLLFGGELFESLKRHYFHNVSGISSASPV